VPAGRLVRLCSGRQPRGGSGGGGAWRQLEDAGSGVTAGIAAGIAAGAPALGRDAGVPAPYGRGEPQDSQGKALSSLHEEVMHT